MIHSLKLRKRGKNYRMVVKLNVSKAYECMEWDFLHHMLKCFGFHPKWIGWILQCVTTVSYSTQINRPSFDIRRLGLRGLVVSMHGPSVSYLLFVNDSILFSHASMEEARIIKQNLEQYSRASGKSINLNKSSLVFSPNTPMNIKQQKQAFNFLVERMDGKLSGWKEKLLSKGGKEVLIKAVCSTIPVYAMV
ncbi:hypothetical protein MANES_13G093526v8 [Manihot esculenta]|uniref:Uncharacterized protein n=1 Tax=Manihot esculenta TaxID=3983 RepID=A0ACB7GKU0_MANES|nr:hypothetical protein MANES_13G093526v8 [Manihot esculenta]